jgi:hypothetical protein
VGIHRQRSDARAAGDATVLAGVVRDDRPSFLALWPNRGCILGGPIIGSVLGLQDLGGWQMRVETTGIATEYILRPVNIYGPPNWKPDDRIENVADTINQALVRISDPGV